MAIHYLSGIEDQTDTMDIVIDAKYEDLLEIGRRRRFFKRRSQGKPRRRIFKKGTIKRVFRKSVKSIKRVGKKVVKTVVRIAASPARAAFLALVRVNGLGMATKLWAVIRGGGELKLQRKWTKAGGKFSTLKRTIIKGKARRERRRAEKGKINGLNDDGLAVGEPLTVAGALLIATPIIAMLAPIIKAFEKRAKEKKGAEGDAESKKLKFSDEDKAVIAEAGRDFVDQLQQAAVDQIAAETPEDAPLKPEKKGGFPAIFKPTTEDGKVNIPFYLMLAAVGGGGIWLATRKKK